MEWTQQNLETLYTQIQKNAMVDAKFRKALLEDPVKTIEKYLGEKLPEGFRLKVIEQDPSYAATLVLPDMVGKELTEEDVADVAGGISFALIILVCGAAIGVGPSVAICGADGCAVDVVCTGNVCGTKAEF